MFLKKGLILPILVIAVSLSACFSGFTAKTTDGGTTYGYLSLDINPSFEIVVDETLNVVFDILPVNHDAQVLLSDFHSTLIGLDVEDAIEKIIEESIKLGYIDLDVLDENNIGNIVASYTSKRTSNRIDVSLLRNRINEFLIYNGIFSEMSIFEDTIEIDSIEISYGHYRMIQRYLEISPEAEINVLVNSDISEIAKQIALNRSEFSNRFTNAHQDRASREAQNQERFNDWKSNRDSISENVRNQIRDAIENNSSIDVGAIIDRFLP